MRHIIYQTPKSPGKKSALGESILQYRYNSPKSWAEKYRHFGNGTTAGEELARTVIAAIFSNLNRYLEQETSISP
jgi:hypothetical protein